MRVMGKPDNPLNAWLWGIARERGGALRNKPPLACVGTAGGQKAQPPEIPRSLRPRSTEGPRLQLGEP